MQWGRCTHLVTEETMTIVAFSQAKCETVSRCECPYVRNCHSQSIAEPQNSLFFPVPEFSGVAAQCCMLFPISVAKCHNHTGNLEIRQ